VPFGPIKFDSSGQNQHPVVITQVQAGQYRGVYPANVAEAKAIVPYAGVVQALTPPMRRRGRGNDKNAKSSAVSPDGLV
jgi:hypothetical protein